MILRCRSAGLVYKACKHLWASPHLGPHPRSLHQQEGGPVMRALPAVLVTSVVLLSSACSDARGPTEGATAPQLDVSANAAATVSVYPGQSIQAAVNANGPST